MNVWSVASVSGGEGSQTRTTDFMRAESWRWREIAGPGFTALPVVNLKLDTLQVFSLDLGGRKEKSLFGHVNSDFRAKRAMYTPLEVSIEPHHLYWTNLAFAFPSNYVCE